MRKVGEVVYVTRREFNDLLEYSHTLPTGTTIGKTWKRKNGTDWYMGEYVPDDDPKMIGIVWTKIVVSSTNGVVEEFEKRMAARS
jgi:hypothetical protein